MITGVFEFGGAPVTRHINFMSSIKINVVSKSVHKNFEVSTYCVFTDKISGEVDA